MYYVQLQEITKQVELSEPEFLLYLHRTTSKLDTLWFRHSIMTNRHSWLNNQEVGSSHKPVSHVDTGSVEQKELDNFDVAETTSYVKSRSLVSIRSRNVSTLELQETRQISLETGKNFFIHLPKVYHSTTFIGKHKKQ